MGKIDLNKYKLRGLLKKKDKNLYNRYMVILLFSVENYLRFTNIENYTNHRVEHVLAVERNIYDLLTEELKEKLTPFETFCLLASACLHDIGMIIKKKSNETTDEIRKLHHERVRDILNEKYVEFQLNHQEAEIIGIICYGHGISDIYELESYNRWSIDSHGEVNTLLLVALLRIGDLLDLSYLRAPRLVADLKMIKGISLYHWKLHDKISDVKISHAERMITIFGKAESEFELPELYKLRNWINDELTLVSNIFKENGIPVDSVTLRTPLDKKTVLTRDNPFLRLASFDWKKHNAFYGRDIEIKDIKKRIIDKELLVLAGESGVGKTSILNAGLKQELIEEGYYVFDVRLTADFQVILKKKIKDQLLENSRGPNDIVRLLKSLSQKNIKVVVFFDQFEELFTFHRHNNLKIEILNLFDDVLNDEEITARFVICLREDFLAEMWEVAEIVPKLYTLENTYRLKKFTPENVKQTIRKTIEYVEYKIDNEFVDKLVQDFLKKEEAIYPPYIQIVCHEVFKRHRLKYKDKSNVTSINEATYLELGGAEKIITSYFEEILDGFSLEEKTVIHDILGRMITYFYTKQRISFRQIEEINNGRIDIENTLKRLIEHRIIKRIETEKHEYELIHDFLAKKILANKPAMGDSSKIRKAITYIENIYHKQISLEDVARKVGVKPEDLSRDFLKKTGEHFISYLNRTRINQAKKIISNDPGLMINEVYDKVGFINHQHFFVVFKILAGLTPEEYKKKELGE